MRELEEMLIAGSADPSEVRWLARSCGSGISFYLYPPTDQIMSQISQPASADFTSKQQAAQVGGANAGYNDLDTDAFLKLLISELQNQDPLDPMDNSEMVQQIGLIREIGATDSLTQTLTSLSDSQELVTASSLIGQSVTGLADDASEVNGIVDRITVETNPENNARSVKVHVGNQTMEIKNLREIQTG